MKETDNERQKSKRLNKRTFKIGENSLRGSIFLMISSTVSYTLLSLPYTFKNSGIIFGLALMFTVAIAQLWSFHILCQICHASGLSSTGQIVLYYFGEVLIFYIRLIILL